MASVVFVRAGMSDAPDSKFIDLLSREERARMQRLVRAEDRASYLAANVTKRLILASAMDRRSTLELEFETNEFGKPSLVNRAIHFNLSHTSGMIAFAWSGISPVGVDVEKCARHLFDRQAAELVLSEAELSAVEESVNPARRFIQLWTMKEAAAKGEGKGLQIDFRKVNPVDDRIRIGSTIWELRYYCPSDSHIATLATPEGYDPEIREWGTMTIEQLAERLASESFRV